MKDIVSNTLKKWRQTDFDYTNDNNCVFSLADYLVDCGYPDFGKDFRGIFSDEESAKRYVEKSGGIEYLINSTGLAPSNNPERGDIMLVKFGKNNIAGIFTGSGLMFRSEKSVLTLNIALCEIVKVWNVENV